MFISLIFKNLKGFKKLFFFLFDFCKIKIITTFFLIQFYINTFQNLSLLLKKINE